MKINDVVKEGHLNLAEGVETDAKVYQNKMTGKFVAWVEIGGKKIDKEGSTKEEALQNLVDHINSLKASRKTATSSRTEVGFTGGFVSLLGMDKFFAKFENGKLLVSDQPLPGYRLVSGAVGQVSPTGNFSVDDIQKAGLELSARYDIKSTDVSGVFNLKHHSDVWGTHDKYYRRDPQLTIQVTGRNTRQQGMAEGMAQDEAEETSGWRAELVNQINYNTFEVKMTNTRSRESANFVVRPVDMISIGPTLQIETMDVHDLQTGQTASWTSDDPQPDGGIVYAIAMMFWDNKELQKKLWTIVDTHNTKGQDKMPGLDQRRSIGQEVDADAYIDSQEKTQDVMAKMKKGMAEGEGNFVGDFPQPNIGGATVKPMQVGDTVSYFGQTAKIQAQSPDRKHSRIEITKGTGGVVQTVLTSDLKRVHRGMAEEFRPTTGQAMGIRSQIAQKMNPDNNKFIWKRPNQIMGSHTENELRALKFRYSAKHNAWGGTQQMWGRLEGTLKELAPSGAGRGGGNYFKTLASAWYNGAFDTGSLQKGIKSKEDVERLLQRGIVCPDGVTRKFGIDYNAKFDGVVISSDDYYEHSDHGKKPDTMIDVRTGQAWGPYDYMEFSDADLSESLTEFAPIKPPTAGAFGGNKDYGQPTSSRYLGNNKFVLGTTNNYVLTATVDKWGLEWDEDDEIWFLDSPGAVYIADATEGEIELPAPQEQRNQIHDLVSDYLNARNSAELQRVAAYYGHSADGEMATSEGVRVPGQQILGTKNRAKTAYYPTNVKPKVPKLDKPLTDQELARLAQLAGIKSK